MLEPVVLDEDFYHRLLSYVYQVRFPNMAIPESLSSGLLRYLLSYVRGNWGFELLRKVSETEKMEFPFNPAEICPDQEFTKWFYPRLYEVLPELHRPEVIGSFFTEVHQHVPLFDPKPIFDHSLLPDGPRSYFPAHQDGFLFAVEGEVQPRGFGRNVMFMRTILLTIFAFAETRSMGGYTFFLLDEGKGVYDTSYVEKSYQDFVRFTGFTGADFRNDHRYIKLYLNRNLPY